MKKVMIIDCGPREGWNTDRLLAEAERGAREAGAQTERIRLFNLDVKDCYGCMICKRVGNKTEGLCAQRDDLRPVLEKCYDADAIIIGSPIYFGNMTAQAHALTCRLMFPAMHYSPDPFDPFEKKKQCALVLTMNVREDHMEAVGYTKRYGDFAGMMGRMLGSCEVLYSCDTLQFEDYSKFYANMFNEEHKRKHHEEQFPIDLQNAYELGKRLGS